MNTTIFDCFNKLIHPNEGERNKNAVNLLRHLFDLNKEEEDKKKEHDYILKRIIRGLGSSNHKSKSINYSLLCSCLSLNNNISADKVLEIVEQELHASSSNAKSEIADVYFGRILAYGALMRSGIMQNSEVETIKKVLEGLLHASKQRSYLVHCATTFLNHYILNIDEEHFRNHVWPVLETEVFKPWKDQNLDSLYLLLILRQQFPSIVTGKEAKKHFGSKDVVSKDNVKEILRILIEIPRIICSNHPVIEVIAQKAVEKGFAKNLWNELDTEFRKPSKTVEHIAAKLVDFFSKLNVSLVPEMLTPNFLHYIMRSCQLSKNSKKDEATALLRESLIKMVAAVGESELDIKMGTIKKLLFCPGDLMIEKKTGIKILHTLCPKLSADNVKELSDNLRKIVGNESEKELSNGHTVAWINMEKIFAAQSLTRLLGHPTMISEHSWRLEHFEFFFKNGLCEQEKLGSDIIGHIKESFYRSIDHKFSSLDSLNSVLTDLVTSINTNVFVEKSWTLRSPLDEKATASWKKMFKLTKKLDKGSKNKSIAVIFGTMNLHMGLQLFQDSELAIPSIDDLHTCYDKVTSKTSEKTDEDEPEWVEVVVDLLLSLLSKKDHLFRSLVQCVFPHICQYLTPSAVHHIFSVLDVNDKYPLTLVKDDDEEESSASESEDEDEMETEHKNGDTNDDKGDSDEDAEDDENEDDEDDDDDDDDDEDDNENQIMMNQLKMTLHQALGDAASHSDVEDIDVDEISEEEGKRLDLSLAAAFKVIRENRRTKSKKQSKNDEILTHFRIRVIDLLEIYLQHSPSMALVLDMIIPLFMLLEHCIQDRHQKPLENRVRSCVAKLSSVKKFSSTEGVDEQIILDILKILMDKGERSSAVYLEMGDKLAQSVTFLIRCLQQSDCPCDSVLDFICEKLTACFKKSILPLAIFKSLLRICWEGNFKLAPIIVNAAFDDNVRPFLKYHALELLVCFYQNDRLLMSQKDNQYVKDMEKKLYENSLRVLNNCSSANGKDVKQIFLGHLFRTLKVVHAKHTKECWNWDEIKNGMEEARGNISSMNTKMAYNKLLHLIKNKVPENRGTKRQSDEDKEHRRKKKAT